MKLIKRTANHYFPKTYQFLFNCKWKMVYIFQKFKPKPSLKQCHILHLIERYQFNKQFAKRIAILGCMEKFYSAFENPALTLGEGCDPNLIVMLVVSFLRADPRVEREAKALAENGYRVVVICPDLGIPSVRDEPMDWGENIEFDILATEATNYANVSPWLQGDLMLEAALLYKPLAFHCHDLNTALIGLAAARQVGSQCVCDFHEWFSENVSWHPLKKRYVPHPKIKREIYQAAEALVMARADKVITVCDSIAQELETHHPEFKQTVHVIRNIPSLSASKVRYPSLRDELSIPSEQMILLWQGGTGPSRLLEPVIQALAYAKNVVLIIRGPSLEYYGKGYLDESRRAKVTDRLHLLPPVKSADVVNAAHGADVGVWTLPNFCKNFYYALPNKLFEYLAAGLPVICAHFPEVRALVLRYQVGVMFDPYCPKSIADALATLTDAAFREQCRQNTALALADIKADQEWKKLVTIYDQLREKKVIYRENSSFSNQCR